MHSQAQNTTLPVQNVKIYFFFIFCHKQNEKICTVISLQQENVYDPWKDATLDSVRKNGDVGDSSANLQ